MPPFPGMSVPTKPQLVHRTEAAIIFSADAARRHCAIWLDQSDRGSPVNPWRLSTDSQLWSICLELSQSVMASSWATSSVEGKACRSDDGVIV